MLDEAGALRDLPTVDDSARFLDAMGDRLRSDAPLRHYSRERRRSPGAR